MACAEAGVKGISVGKPLGGVLSDIDKMLSVCESRGVVFAGGSAPPAVVDDRNANTTDGVQWALGREPWDFTDYARTAAAGVWDDR